MPYFQFNLPGSKTAQISKELRDNLEALATTNATNDTSKPVNPRNGMLRFFSDPVGSVSFQYYWNGWKTLFVNLQLGVSVVKRVEISSLTPILVWTINHNFGANPIVQFIDATGFVRTPESVQHINENRVIVTHGDALAGKVVLLG